MKQNGVTDDALCLYLFPYSLTHHATAWFDRLLKNSIHTFQEMASKFLSKYDPPSMVTKLRNDISNFRHLLDESLFKAWEHLYEKETFMKRRPEECYDLIENMTAHHNDWDTSAHRGESSSSITSSSFEIAAFTQKMSEIRKDILQMYRTNRQVNSVTHSCETCGGPHSYYECQATGGYTQDVYATSETYNAGGNSYQPQGNRNLLSYRSNNFLGPPGFNPPNNQNQGNNQNFQKNQNRFNQGQGYNQNRAQPNVPSLEEMMLQHMRLTEAKMQQMQNHNDQQIQHLKTQNTQMANLMGQVQKALQERPQGALPSNTIPNPREEIKAITTRSGNVLAGPSILPPPPFSSSKEVERDPETITNQVLPESTTRVPPPVVQPSPSSRSSEIPPSPTSTSSELPKRNPHQPQILYPSRLNKEKLQDKSDIQVHKFFQMLKKLHFNISLAEALALMPKYHKMLKDLLSDKEKLLGLANTSLTENCSAVLLKKLPEKLGDPRKFLIPCDFPELEKCMALADLGASINLMPLSVWKKLMLPELVPTRMTLELANRSIAYPAGIAEDVFIQVGKFTFPADFVVADYDADPRVPLILGRPFLRTARALVDVYGKELILRDGDEKLIFHADSTSKHPQKHVNESINMINFINITCEDRFEEVLKIKKSNHPFSGSTTSPSDSFPSLTPFKTSDSLLEEFTDELGLLDPFPLRNEDDNFDPEADLREIEYLLNHDPSTDSSPTIDIDIIDPILERFTYEPALVYSSPPRDDDDDDDDLFDLKSDNDEWKKLLYVTQDKNLKEKTSTEAPLILEERNFLSISSDQELLFPLELSVTETLLSFSSENEDKVFNPEILISKGVYSFTLIPYDREDHRACFQSSNHSVSDHLHVGYEVRVSGGRAKHWYTRYGIPSQSLAWFKEAAGRENFLEASFTRSSTRNDEYAPRSRAMIGWLPERTKMPPPTLGYLMDTQSSSLDD
ncbi:reverse transcriptase domain-containing protein [Tanacetum coccineum]|uniref:Reverse transcriptase domain-containing protein n=1 Tax=Tanacetum coccineum TaxID=301880 RepID=A0ABQ4ZUV1_9ASTR